MCKSLATFECLINMANNKHRSKGVANIRKVPTPIQITKDKVRFVIGIKENTGWVVYTGVYNGPAIAFDAKETSIANLPFYKIHLTTKLIHCITYKPLMKKCKLIPLNALDEK
ncbi:Holliday junction resolvase RecU [Lysinibacillus parviboronicapiens]|uniref:Holliday junction resolvase RecU n=1 Tax=Lysinibacillus parviboronicapiens TaxID=436516 RepID=UPI0023784CF0|nr:Holliday junction resolvase RecU [Lysinibacillus parviboronicapiens]